MADGSQNQKVGGGALAVQSARDTIITTGMTPEDMGKILQALADQIPTYTAIARTIVEERLHDFKDEVLKKFNQKDAADPAAFANPDFQYLLTRAQHAYAQSGDTITRDTLIDLIARRSKETQRGRLALTLNSAVEKAAVLTKNEFAELSLIYLLRYTVNNSVRSWPLFFQYCQTYIDPFLDDVENAEASYQYLESQGCGSLGIMTTHFLQILQSDYGGIFSRGFSKAEFSTQLPTFDFERLVGSQLVIPCLNDSSKFQLRAINLETLRKFAGAAGVSENEAQTLWSYFQSTFYNEEDLLQRVEQGYPNIRKAKALWDNGPLNRVTLTSVGIAIGHSNLVRLTGWQADLAIWIK